MYPTISIFVAGGVRATDRFRVSMPSRCRPGPRSLLPEDPLLLALELVLREHALVPQLGQALELARRGGGGRRHGGRGRTRGCRGGRHRWCRVAPHPSVHPILVELALLVDRLLDVLGVADVAEHLAPELARRADGQVAGPDPPLEHP